MTVSWRDLLYPSRREIEREQKHELVEGGPESKPDGLATDPTPTRIRWSLDGRWLVGIEQPVEHHDRAAGKYLLDNGEWREIRYVGIELPDDVETALTLRLGDEPADPPAENEDGTHGREHITSEGRELRPEAP